jgi:NAD(P)-dependent dehydrogenase (short-subunit alcohol dehydrogenase family)
VAVLAAVADGMRAADDVSSGAVSLSAVEATVEELGRRAAVASEGEYMPSRSMHTRCAFWKSLMTAWKSRTILACDIFTCAAGTTPTRPSQKMQLSRAESEDQMAVGLWRDVVRNPSHFQCALASSYAGKPDT